MAAPQNGEDPKWGELPQFRTLRRLITLLTATLIIGIMTIAAVLIWRIASEPGRTTAAVSADQVVLPEGAEITSVGATSAALSVAVREDGEESLLIFDPSTGALIKRVAIARE